MTATNTTTSATVPSGPVNPSDWVMATMPASRLQAVTSLMAAHVSAMVPSGVVDSLRSSRILASTGKAVMLIEIAMNSANEMLVALGPPYEGNSTTAISTPRRAGTRILNWLMTNAEEAFCLTWLTS